MASGDTLLIFTARDGVPTATTGASHRMLAGASSPAEGVPYLAFDSATAEYVDFFGVLPRAYGGGGLTATLYWASGATSGDTVWGVAFQAIPDDAQDINTTVHSYDYNAATATTASAAGEVDYVAIAFTDGVDMDSLAAGEFFVMRIRRDAPNGSDNMTGDSYLMAVEVRET